MSIKKIYEQIEKFLNEESLCEMSNLRKNRTGLPVNISLQIETDEDKKYPHNLPRLKFQNNTADRVTSNSDLIPVSIEDEPKVLINKDYDKKLFKFVKKWIQVNKEVLLKFWNQEIDEYDLKDMLN